MLWREVHIFSCQQLPLGIPLLHVGGQLALNLCAEPAQQLVFGCDHLALSRSLALAQQLFFKRPIACAGLVEGALASVALSECFGKGCAAIAGVATSSAVAGGAITTDARRTGLHLLQLEEDCRVVPGKLFRAAMARCSAA